MSGASPGVRLGRTRERGRAGGRHLRAGAERCLSIGGHRWAGAGPWSRELRSRRNMVRQQMSQTWILVGDGSHARLFQAPDASQPWSLVRTLDREHSREKTDIATSHGDQGELGFAQKLAGE